MGTYLAKPNLNKISDNGENTKLKFGSNCMQGWRINMEDAHINELNIGNDISWFGIFDGHGGAEVAQYCKFKFIEVLKKNKNFLVGKFEDALKESFYELDLLLDTKDGKQKLKDFKIENEDIDSYAGCTANIVLIYKNNIYIANCGDSRAIMYSNKNIIKLSYDHSLENQKEIDRIKKAGGRIVDGRIEGNLNLTRSIGDLEYKRNKSLSPNQQLIISEPDIIKRKIIPQDNFIWMGCDGIFEKLTEEEICDIIDNKLRNNPNIKLSWIIEEIFDKAIAETTNEKDGCDNMSCVIILLKNYN